MGTVLFDSMVLRRCQGRIPGHGHESRGECGGIGGGIEDAAQGRGGGGVRGKIRNK